MGVYKRGDRWWVRHTIPGAKQIREAVSFKGVKPEDITERMAEDYLAILRSEVVQGKYDNVVNKKAIRFEQLIQRYLEYVETYKTYHSYERDVTSAKHLSRFFKGKPINNLTSWQVEKYLSARQKEATIYGRPPSNASLNREIAMLRHMYNKAIEWNLVSSNPAAKIKPYKEKAKPLAVLTEDEFENLYDAASDFLKPILMVAVHTGMRRNEILNLKRSDVNMQQGYVLVRETKNNEIRSVSLSEELRNELKPICDKINDENAYVFPGKDGKPVKSIKSSFRGALKRSGINHIRFHDLRHCFGSKLATEGVELPVIKKLMGHKDLSTTMRYLHPSPQHEKDAVEKISYSKSTNKAQLKVAESE